MPLAIRRPHPIKDFMASESAGNITGEEPPLLAPSRHKIGRHLVVYPKKTDFTEEYDFGDSGKSRLNPGDKFLAIHLSNLPNGGILNTPAGLREFYKVIMTQDMVELAKALEGEFKDYKLVVGASPIIKPSLEDFGFHVRKRSAIKSIGTNIGVLAERKMLGMDANLKSMLRGASIAVITREEVIEKFGTHEKALETWNSSRISRHQNQK